MRVGIDLTALLPEATGVDVFMLSLVQALARIDPDTRYTIFVNAEDHRSLVRRLPGHFRVVPLCLRPRPARLLFQQVVLPAAAALARLDVVHSPSFILPMLRGRRSDVLTVHDFTSFSRPDCHIALRRSAAYRRAVAASVRRAHAVTVPSESVRADLLSRFPEVPASRVHVVNFGIGEEFRPRPRDQARAGLRHLPLPERFILFVGTLEPRKNLLGLLAAYRRLLRRIETPVDLVLAGRLGWGYEPLLEELASPDLRGRVHRIGYVAQRDLPALYAAADVFAFPSFEEGFGFPPLEAMACGVPTVASATSSLAENLSGAAELVPCGDAEGLATALERVLRDRPLRETMRRAGLGRAASFRWSETARGFHHLYAELASGH